MAVDRQRWASRSYNVDRGARVATRELVNLSSVAMKTIDRFLDKSGRLRQWPSKRSDQLSALAYLAGKFEPGQELSERSVNETLKLWHLFADWALLRRELYDEGYIARTPDGGTYMRTDKLPGAGSQPEIPAEARQTG